MWLYLRRRIHSLRIARLEKFCNQVFQVKDEYKRLPGMIPATEPVSQIVAKCAAAKQEMSQLIADYPVTYLAEKNDHIRELKVGILAYKYVIAKHTFQASRGDLSNHGKSLAGWHAKLVKQTRKLERALSRLNTERGIRTLENAQELIGQCQALFDKYASFDNVDVMSFDAITDAVLRENMKLRVKIASSRPGGSGSDYRSGYWGQSGGGMNTGAGGGG